jgi:hypothetical protein
MKKIDYTKTQYDLGNERDIVWLHQDGMPAYLRESMVTMRPCSHDYAKPSIISHADLYAFSTVNSAHNLMRQCRVWYLLTDVPDGLDTRTAPPNLRCMDRLVDPTSIEAGKHSRPARNRRADKRAKRFIKRQRAHQYNTQAYFDNKNRWPQTLLQKIKRWLGVRYV